MPTQPTLPKPLLLLWESFTALLPIVLTMSALVLLSGFANLLETWGITGLSVINGDSINRLYIFLLPLFLNLSLSAALAKSKGLDPISSQLIAMICFVRISGFLLIDPGYALTAKSASLLTSIVSTWIAIELLHALYGLPKLQLLSPPSDIHPRLQKTFRLIVAGILTVFCFEIAGQLLRSVMTTDLITPFLTHIPKPNQLPPLIELLLYKVVALFTWAMGLHGEHSAEGLFKLLNGVPYLGHNRIALDNLHNVFMNIGGSGSTFVIPILILCNKRRFHFQSIARFSLLFSFFNVNEILMFGLPIILNPFLLVPFLLAPFINLLIALSMIHLGAFSLLPDAIPWMSMPLYSAYIASDGSLWAVLTQLVCIIADGVVYFPFLILASRQQAAPMALKQLFTDEKYGALAPELRQQQDQQLTTQPQQTLSQLTLTQKVLKQMQNGRFQLYYQPKVDAQSLEVIGFEALLRLQNRQGGVSRPSFLPVLYQHGLSKTIDYRVLDLAFDDLLYWRSIGLSVPPIAINFDKAFLLDTQAVRTFLKRASYHRIRFDIEITEHTYTTEIHALAAVINRIREAGHRVAIDDFGAGYSCLTSLLSLEVDEIKLDRQLVVPPSTQEKRGELLLESSVKLCHELGFLVVAEGIETREHLKRAQRCGVDVLQGYYLDRPMSHHQMTHYLADSWFRPTHPELRPQTAYRVDGLTL